MADVVVVQMVSKFSKYNIDERVSLPEHLAEQWCGEVNPRFKVAVRLPADDQTRYFESPANKMVGVSDVAKADEKRGPGRPPRKE